MDIGRPLAPASDAGLRATLGAISMFGALALGAALVERLIDAAAADASDDIPAAAMTAPAAPTEAAPEARAVAPARRHHEMPVAVVANAAMATLALDETTLVERAEAVPVAPLGYDLSRPHSFPRHAGPVQAYAPPPPASSGGRSLEAMAKGWVPDWRTPDPGDLSLFVASDDEAVSWALSGRSPNHGRLAYQDDRVEVGQLSAGVSMALPNSQVALAYLERDAPAQFGYSTREDMAGVVWTMRR